MHHIDAGHQFQQLAVHIGRAADAERGIVDLARIGLGIGDEFGKRFGRDRRIDHQHIGRRERADDRRDVLLNIEREVLIERGIDRVGHRHRQERVAVGRSAGDDLGGKIAAGARPVVDDEFLAELLPERRGNQAHVGVGRGAGREADDDAHRPRRIVVRLGNARDGRERGSGPGELQKLTAAKFHGVGLR